MSGVQYNEKKPCFSILGTDYLFIFNKIVKPILIHTFYVYTFYSFSHLQSQSNLVISSQKKELNVHMIRTQRSIVLQIDYSFFTTFAFHKKHLSVSERSHGFHRADDVSGNKFTHVEAIAANLIIKKNYCLLSF
jgi:hypothetical protein